MLTHSKLLLDRLCICASRKAVTDCLSNHRKRTNRFSGQRGKGRNLFHF